MSLLIVLILSGFVAGSLLLEASGDLSPAAVATIDRNELRSTLYFLASDSLAGRDTASPGNRIAADYLAHRFELMGLEPAGDPGSFRQAVPLVKTALGEGNRLSVVAGDGTVREGIFGETFYPAPLTGTGRISAPAVFAGYGITAPEYDYDDYAAVDVSRKVAVVLEGEPSADGLFLGPITTEYGRVVHKILNAQSRGAAALVFARLNAGRQFARGARSSWPAEPGRTRFQLGAWADSVKIPVVFAGPSLIEPLTGGPGSLQRLREALDTTAAAATGSLPLQGAEIRIETSVSRQTTVVSNVIAKVAGSDPSVAGEAVVIGAHFDHVGRRGERIYNGADDDASGTVAVLEIAQAFALSESRPRRTVIFAFWNAEERGLLGSRRYVLDPAGTRPQITAMFQLDMVGRNEEVPDGDDRRFRGLQPQTSAENSDSVHVIGYSFSPDMRRLVSGANEITGLRLKFELDGHPISLLTRSDHWPFLAAGVPSIFLTSGLHPDYHQPSDTAEKINYEKLEKIARLAFVSAWTAADLQGRPRLDGPRAKSPGPRR